MERGKWKERRGKMERRKEEEGREEESAGPQGLEPLLETQTHRQASHGRCLSELVCMGEGFTVAQEEQHMSQQAAVVGLGLH